MRWDRGILSDEDLGYANGIRPKHSGIIYVYLNFQTKMFWHFVFGFVVCISRGLWNRNSQMFPDSKSGGPSVGWPKVMVKWLPSTSVKTMGLWSATFSVKPCQTVFCSKAFDIGRT